MLFPALIGLAVSGYYQSTDRQLAEETDTATTDEVIDTPSPKMSPRSYTYVFTGRATCDGRPCSNTRIDLLVSSPKDTIIQHAQTNDTGEYRVTVPIVTTPETLVSWEIYGLSDQQLKGSAEGHQILTDEVIVPVEVPLQLAKI